MRRNEQPPPCRADRDGEDRWEHSRRRVSQQSSIALLALVLLLSPVMGMTGMGMGTRTALAATRTLCQTLYSNKQFVRAAQCYHTLAKALQNKGKRTTEEISDLNQFLRNAALCMQRKAKTEQSAIRQSYWYERALSFVQTLLKNRYYADASQKNLSVYIRNQVNEKISYTQVTVNTGIRPAKVSITGGYRFEAMQQQSQLWQVNLRPGSYTILCQHPQGNNVAKVLKLTRSSPPIVVSCAPPTKVDRTPPVLIKPPALAQVAKPNRVPGIALLVGGSVALAAGIGLITWGVLENEQNNQVARSLQQQITSYDLETAQTTSAQRNNLVAEHQDAVSKYGAGLGVGVAGAISLVLGAILYAHPAQVPAPPPLSQKKAKSSVVFQP